MLKKENIIQKKTILIIDDQYFVIRSLSRILLQEGYDVMTAYNGFQALQKLNMLIPDLLIIDINMPVMDGFQTIKLIHERENLKNIPIIVLTAFTDLKTILRIKELGINDYIAKPSTQQNILQRIKTTLGEEVRLQDNKKDEEIQKKRAFIKNLKEQRKQWLLKSTIKKNKMVLGKGVLAKNIHIAKAHPGMILASPVRNKNNNLILFSGGTELTPRIIEQIKKHDIYSIEVMIKELNSNIDFGYINPDIKEN